jgi:hypothetical protein
MKRTSLLLLALSLSAASLFCDNRHIAFERDQAVWIANLDRTSEKKIADGIFPAISPDGTRIAFNTTEKTSDTTYARHIAIVLRACLVAGWKTARFFNNDRECVAPRLGERRRLRVSACEECRVKA